VPSEDEIRRYQQEHRPNLAEQLLQVVVPAVKFDPIANRHRLAALFQQEYMQTPPEPDKDYPYQKDTAL